MNNNMISLKIEKNIATFNINEQSDLELIFKIFKFLISNSKWVPLSVYKIKIGKKSEITRKKGIHIQLLRKFTLEEFIEYIIEGIRLEALNSGEIESTNIDGIEIRSALDFDIGDVGEFIEEYRTW
jgi:hypothetical protein